MRKAPAAAAPTPLDRLFAEVCQGDEGAFEMWLTRVELPLRRTLQPWARAVDVESVVQETLHRVWIFAQERGETLEGENASLRWAVGVARNVARNEARRFGREQLAPSGDLPEVAVEPEPPPDPGLVRVLKRCLQALSGRPREALEARLHRGDEEDRALAAELGMKPNTFLQNIVRARKQLRECLTRNGAPVEEFLS
ncbi:MAG: hypothetical protein WD960_08425 [Gemmatimonadota bacterium]